MKQSITSLEAREKYLASGKQETDYTKIINALFHFANQKSIYESVKMEKTNNFLDPTYLELSNFIGFVNPNKVARRMSELVRLNKVKVTGTKICTIGKNKCRTYSLV